MNRNNPNPGLKSRLWILILALLICLAAGTAGPVSAETAPNPSPPVSGELVNGLRVIPLAKSEAPFQITVYRGDYVVFQPLGFDTDPVLTIPQLDVQQPLSRNTDTPPYFKMKTPGTYEFSLGSVQGRILVLEYRHSGYHEINATQAAQRITQNSPLLLDVRTPQEFQQGHIPGARLLPVQELQKRLGELQAYKDQEILIYCATGNRSTVAAKILVDQGFTDIYNLRNGIREWLMEKRPIER